MYLTYKSVYLSLNTSTAQCCTPLFELKNPKNPEKPMTFVHACSKQYILKNESGYGVRVKCL